ncbi:GntR family transcriptional regulator [Fodinicola feengrottensis]|uniref:GntR family transcriptional regulator n=1 Tax=Fodinicola feengrottensis TaxID=435914 RepID=A0ABN2H0J8_9ACTN
MRKRCSVSDTGWVPRSRHQIDVDALRTKELAAGRPKGHQLREILEDLAGGLGPGGLMPSERVLAEYFAVSRTTVRQEIERMVADGLLFRRHGHGTLVAEPKPAHLDLLTSFSQDMRARGMVPGSVPLAVSVEPASSRLATRLQVAPASPVLHLVRLRTADRVPMAVEHTDVSVHRFPGIQALDWADRSLFATLEERWSVRPATSDAHIASVLPDAEQARALAVEPSQPCLLIDGVTRDTTGAVLESSRSLFRGDRYEVLARVGRN